MRIQITSMVIKVIVASLLTGASLYAKPSECPSGFVSVPGDLFVGTTDFCVMQFEAKAWFDKNANKSVDFNEIKSNGCDGDGNRCDGGNANWGLNEHVPASVPQGRPWRNISRDSSIKECQELNKVYANQADASMEFDLITNKEWQTIARNIEKQKDNWSKGKVGFGCLNQGNSGLQSDCSYDGGNPERGSNERASHTLSNGESIYHFSGNLWEWVKDDNASKQGRDQFISKNSESDYGAEGKYTCDFLNSHCGFGFGWLEYSEGAVIRGGDWSIGDLAGVFAAFLKVAPSDSSSHTGFRCVYRPVDSNKNDGYE